MNSQEPKHQRLPLGLYDRLIYSDESIELNSLDEFNQALIEAPSEAQRREHLIYEITERLPELLDDIGLGSNKESEKAQAELKLIGHLLREGRLQTKNKSGDRMPAEPLRILKALHNPNAPPALPLTGLRRPWLFTSARSDPSLLGELRAELATVDRVDILVSFITWSGVRKLLDVITQATARNAQGTPRTHFRILTTTYIGATEARAVNCLAELPGVELRISLDGRRSRLHAKAWIFHRDTGFGTAFVGSANLSESALIGGIEWTVKTTQAKDVDLFSAAGAHFETLWNDREFQPYNPHDEEQRESLEKALKEQRRDPRITRNPDEPIAIHTWFDLSPKTYQLEMLERLSSERKHGRLRNLVVAATGTGKTVVSAFDYQRISKAEGSPPRLLYVAHRVQILKQALATYRQVLREPSFGDLLDGQNEPTQHDHLFATIQTIQSRSLVSKLGIDFWRVVVIDEAHHIPATSFDLFARSVKPHILLGLTATPERSDGRSLNEYFDTRPDGSHAVSLRLWDALDQQLVAPFEYYATADDTDFSTVRWNRAEETSQLDQLISSNTVRSRTVTHALEKYVADLASLKGIVFCVSVAHARFMADWFNKSGISTESLTGTNTSLERQNSINKLRSGEIKLICTCDLFNEGVDIPEVNTLLLLRPTQSPVVFQQQIGRGLRLADGKDSCLVLDFVGQYNNEFRFDTLLRTITGLSRTQLQDSVEYGFGLLPTGCHIQFDRVSRERVLANLREALNLNATRLRNELSAWAALRHGKPLLLKDFLHENQLDISDIYNNRRSWTVLKRDAGLSVSEPGPREYDLSRSLGRVLHTDDPTLLSTWAQFLLGGKIDPSRVQMLAYQLLDKRQELIDPDGFSEMLRTHPAIRDELIEIIDYLSDETTVSAEPLPEAPTSWPLNLHSRYSRREIQTAAGHLTPNSRPMFNEGCLLFESQKIELMFVTLDKSEGFTERVQYHDYAISPDLFHWQTQNRAGFNNATGRRYLDSHINNWRFQLFVRENKDSAYVAMGPVHIEKNEGDRPISITWKLKIPMPIHLFRQFSILRGA